MLVYDFGGGTFDVSALSVRNNTFVVRASGGDLNLGGRDVDRSFLKTLYEEIKLEPDYSVDVSALKEALSKSSAPIKYTLTSPQGEKGEVFASNETLNRVVLPYVDRTMVILNDVLNEYEKNVGATRGQTKVKLILVGGSSYLPGLKTRLKALPFVEDCIDLPDARAAVAAGCALYSSCLTDDSPMLLVDCASHNVSTPNFKCESIVCVTAGSPIPFSGTININMRNSTASAVYKATLFEGDYNKCPRNRKIFSGEVRMADVGVTSTVSTTIAITLEVNVSSVGTIEFRVKGPNGKSVMVGDKPMYDFSSVTFLTRSVAELHKHSFNKVLYVLSLTRTPAQRKSISVKEAENTFSQNVSENLETELKKNKNFDQDVFSVLKLLLGRSISKILRGSRLEKLLL
jgi:molecular chaperone DnaK (HSP70)